MIARSNKNINNTKAVIFARVSSFKQENNNSLGEQIFTMSEYCQRKKFEVIDKIKPVESSIRGDREKFIKQLTLCNYRKDIFSLQTINL